MIRPSILPAVAALCILALPVFAMPSETYRSGDAGSMPLCSVARALSADSPVAGACDVAGISAGGDVARINLSDYVRTVVTCDSFGRGGSLNEGMAAVALEGIPGALAFALIGVAYLAVAGHRRALEWIAAWACAIRAAGASALPRLAACLVSARTFAAKRVGRLHAGQDAVVRLVETVELSFAGLLRRLDAEPALEAGGNGLSVPNYQMISAVRGGCVARTAFCFAVARPAARRRWAYGYSSIGR